MTDFVDGISDGQFSITQIKASTARFRTYASTQSRAYASTQSRAYACKIHMACTENEN